MTRHPTMIEVAHEAGVSPATVSRVLTGSAHVAAGTRRQVHAIAVRGTVNGALNGVRR